MFLLSNRFIKIVIMFLQFLFFKCHVVPNCVQTCERAIIDRVSLNPRGCCRFSVRLMPFKCLLSFCTFVYPSTSKLAPTPTIRLCERLLFRFAYALIAFCVLKVFSFCFFVPLQREAPVVAE